MDVANQAIIHTLSECRQLPVGGLFSLLQVITKFDGGPSRDTDVLNNGTKWRSDCHA